MSFSLTKLAHAVEGSYHLSHPLGWIHQLPTGEPPGWNKNYWLDLEYNYSSIWNAPLTMTNINNGKKLEYAMAFEQSSAYLNFGFQVSSHFSVEFEIPYLNRGIGSLNNFLIDFHKRIGSRTFNRDQYNVIAPTISVKTDDVEQIQDEFEPGIYTSKLKFKIWLWKKVRTGESAFPGGLSFGYQTVVPLSSYQSGLANKQPDNSFLWYLGTPLGSYSSIWFTGGVTHIHPSPIFEDWPFCHWQQIYEVQFALGFNARSSLIIGARAESPFLNKDSLHYENSTTDEQQYKLDRMASGWNALTLWRSSETIGYQFKKEHWYFRALFVEDLGLGDRDDVGDKWYVNNSPDFSGVLQLGFEF